MPTKFSDQMPSRPNAAEKAAIEYLSVNQSQHGDRIIALRDAVESRFPGAIDRAVAKRAKEYQQGRFNGPVPTWAKRLFLKHAPRRADLRWRRSSTTLRGTCDGIYHVTVTERIGESEERMRILLLHEIAHFVGSGHDVAWTAEFRRLLAAEGLYRAALKSNLTGQSKLRRVKKAAARGY
jgi:hypothetical protein